MDNRATFPRLLSDLGRIGALIGVIGVLILCSALLKSSEQFFQAYLYGWVFWISLTIGCYGLMLLQSMLRAQWGVPLIRLFEAGAKMMPWMGLAFLPIIYAIFNGQQYLHLYPWANPDLVAHDSVLKHRHDYFGMNPTMFLFKTIVYFTVFTLTTYFLSHLASEQDRTGNMELATSRASVAAPSFLIMVLLVTLAITDWVMSLDPHWYSTIYGFWFCIGSALLGMSFATLLACLLRLTKVEPYATLVTPQLTKDLGNLLLMMTMVWAYFSVSQYLITWSGNLPTEVIYYVKRNAGLMAWVSIFMVLVQFFIPFLMLLSGKTKKYPRLLISVTLLIIFGRIVECAWNIIPMFHPLYAGLYAQLTGIIYYIGAWLGIGGLWLFGFVSLARRNSLIPSSEVVRAEVFEHAS